MAESLEATVARLDERTDSILRELQRQADDAKKLALDIGNVLETIGEVHALKDDIAGLRDELQATRERAQANSDDLITVKSERGQERRAQGRRERILEILGAAFAGGAVTLVFNYLGHHL